ncbi:hypothetical protein JTE90_029533 [Oedothorax gibbosus]|uniref:Uncharacterized protein n=1 Tax=Oedothorax gibbosus TaxID=931172 RepID=A0AAV6VAZ3_9ARAC|nr:hypothetical protein JTE90_029533 [Oedothorax gibbosus]
MKSSPYCVEACENFKLMSLPEPSHCGQSRPLEYPAASASAGLASEWGRNPISTLHSWWCDTQEVEEASEVE